MEQQLDYSQQVSHGFVLDLVRQLCKALERENINYCHWKSNAALDRSASGENDLDLLISRADGQRFTKILYELGFKQANLPADQQLPGILDYYGYDPKANQLIHVHAHYQLILGHDRTKNYRLPIEKPFLDSVTQGDLFKTPTDEFEFIVFVIRMILKYSTWDVVLGRQSDLPKSARNELSYLQERVNQSQIDAYLQEHLPYISPELFQACVASLQKNYSIWKRVQLGHQVQKQLQAHARRIHWVDVYLKIWRRLVRAIQRRRKSLPKKRFVNGGIIIAIVGGDGAGKSTAIEELYGWLSKTFDTIQVHLGKPPWSPRTILIRGGLKVIRLLTLPFSRQRKQIQDSDQSETLQYSPLIWEVCAARDRYLHYVKARRFATNGGIVICDRFPLPQKIKLMDGPLIEELVAPEKINKFIQFLIKQEKYWYQYIQPPEILIVLRLNPELAVQRKTTEKASHVRPRSTEIWELDWQGTPAHVIDASCSKEEVILQLKKLIWSNL